MNRFLLSTHALVVKLGDRHDLIPPVYSSIFHTINRMYCYLCLFDVSSLSPPVFVFCCMAAVASGVALVAGSGVTVGQVKAVAELALVMAQIVSVVKKMKTPDDQSVRDAVRAGGELGLEARRGSGVAVSVVPAVDESADSRGSGDSGSRAVSDSEETARFMEALLREAKVEVKSGGGGGGGDSGDGDGGGDGGAAGDGGEGFRVTIGGASVDLDSPGPDEEVELDNINLDDLDTLLQDGDGDSLGSMISGNMNKDK